MSDKFKNKYRISSTRLKNWDYRNNGAYFITICTKNREHFFGEINPASGTMQLNEIGKLAEQFWFEIPMHFPFVALGEFIVMPNHTHGILIIDKMIDHETVDASKQFSSINSSVVSSVASEFVSPVVFELVYPVGSGLVSPVGSGLVSPVGSGLVSPVGSGLVSPVGSGLVSPVEALHCNASTGDTNTGDKTIDTNTGDKTIDTNTGDKTIDTNTGDKTTDTNTVGQTTNTNTGDSVHTHLNLIAITENKKNEMMANISPKPGSISTIIRSYKSVVTKNAHFINPNFAWQSRFHDHIIRNQSAFDKIQKYIANNPKNWKEDRF